MNRRLTAAGALVVVLAFGSVAAAMPIFDPVGDTFNTGTHDIVSSELMLQGGVFTAKVQFAGPVAAASAAAANSVVGYVDLDTDQNAATGGTLPFGGPLPGGNSFINLFILGGLVPGPPIALGDEFYVDLFSEATSPGFVNVVNATTDVVAASVAISYLGSSVEFSIPAAILGGTSAINFGVLAGDLSAPTDRAPNDQNPAVSSTIPEPGVLALSLLGFGLLRHRRRRVY